jgi:uncharacterized membrane protein
MFTSALAQSATTKATQGDIVLWVAVLVVIAFVGGILILWVRKKTLAKDHPAAAGSLMDQLRTMLQRGEITQAEFDATRKAMVKKLAAALREQPPKPLPQAKNRPHRPRDTDQSA